MDQDIPYIDPRHTVLLVMDYQSGILSSLPNTNELLAKMKNTIVLARQTGIQIGYVRVAFSDTDYQNIPKNNKSFSALAENRQMDSEAPETQVHTEVAPEANDIIVRKTRVGAFSTTDLAQQLQDKDIDTLILAGVATSGVVLSTLRDAADHDYRLYVLEDLCADRDPEVHTVLTSKVFPRQAFVITSSELPHLLESK